MTKDKKKSTGFRFRISVMVMCIGMIVVALVSNYENALGAEKYPTRPVSIIVPFSAGAAGDYLARFMGEELSKKWNQPVNIINKPGGNTVIGTQAVMSAPPDGYTILLDGVGSSSAQMSLKGLPYDVLNRTYLTMTISLPQVLIVSSNTPWKSLKDLAEAGRKDPASIVWGAGGGGRSGSDMTQLQFFKAAGIDASKTRKVDFAGSAMAINALAGDHIKLHAASPAAVNPAISSGKAKALATTAPKRTPLLPECPTTKELGYPAVDYVYWVGFSGPPGLPAYVTEIFVKTVEEILKDPDVAERLGKKFDSAPTFLGPKAYKEFVQKEAVSIESLVKLMDGSK